MIVVDTNIIAYLALPGPYTLHAERLLKDDPAWAAPFLWRSEFCNVLLLYLRKKQISLSAALAMQEEMQALMRGREFDIPPKEVLQLAHASTCSAYDCEFVVLSRMLGVPLITMDRRLVSCFPDDCLLLTDRVA